MSGRDRFQPEDFSQDQAEVQATLDRIYNPPTGKEDTGPEIEWKKSALPRIQLEMDRIRSGTSKFTKYAIQDSGLIVLMGFQRLQEDFTPENVNKFLSLAKQDYNEGTREFFEKLLKGESEDD